MKTPREFLFERHRSAEAKLDDIRQNVVASFGETPARKGDSGRERRRVPTLREFLLPLRWHLAGMSAAWVIIAMLNVERGSVPAPTTQNGGPPRQLLVALLENRRQLAELAELPVAEPAPEAGLDRARPSGSRPRSERHAVDAVV